MAILNQLVGGFFSDSEGNPAANGYLLLQLNQDGIVNTTTLVCSQSVIKIPLDVSGNVIVTPAYKVWSNDNLGAGSFYTVSCYTVTGLLIWGPNPQSVLSSTNPYNIGQWIPGKV